MAAIGNQLVSHTIGDSLNDAHKAASRMEGRLGQLLSELTGECASEDVANCRHPGLNASAADLVNRLHSVASLIERVQELVTGNPDLMKQGIAAGGSGGIGRLYTSENAENGPINRLGQALDRSPNRF